MRKLKFMFAAILCLAIMFMVSAPSMAESDETALPADMPLEELLAAMVGQINALTEQVNILTEQLNALQTTLAPGEANTAILSQQIDDARLTEKYIAKIEYNNTCLQIKNIELAERRLALADSQLKVEKMKLELGESTQNAVDTLAAQKLGLELSINADRAAVNAKKAYLNVKNADYTVPTVVEERFNYTAAELQTSLLGNNATLHQYNDQLSTLYNMPNADGLAIEQVNAQRRLYEDQLCRIAADRYAAYTSALAQYKAAEALRPVLAERIKITGKLYENGEISELAKLEQEYALYEKLYSADATSIALIGSISELELMRQGVVAG